VSKSENGEDYTFQTDTVADFWQGFTSSALCALHIDVLRGRSDHHKIEAMFKSVARALRDACEIDARLGGRIPSTKGTLGK
jgi:imidazoleglycerol-phosphate dehydratase